MRVALSPTGIWERPCSGSPDLKPPFVGQAEHFPAPGSGRGQTGASSWLRLLANWSAASAAVLIGKFDAGLSFGDGLPHQVHGPAAVAAFVGGGFL